MKPEIAREVIECLPSGRTLFPYAKDDYAFLLLKIMSGTQPRIHNLRQSPVAKLLEKPAIKPFLASCSRGFLDPDTLPENQYNQSLRCYRLTLDEWDGSDRYWRNQQVSRKGSSLVLQMNLNRDQTNTLRSTYMTEKPDPFRNFWHPVRNGDFPTLAWARIDMDIDSGEALIEELQTDLLRDLKNTVERAYNARNEGKKTFEYWRGTFSYRTLDPCLGKILLC